MHLFEQKCSGPRIDAGPLQHGSGIRIGLFGLTVQTAGVQYIEEFRGEQETARELTADLRARGAEVVIAVTHLNASADRRLLEVLGKSGPDLIIGGHDHESVAFLANGRFVLKADADARTATIARLTLKADGTIDFDRLRTESEAHIARWNEIGREICERYVTAAEDLSATQAAATTRATSPRS